MLDSGLIITIIVSILLISVSYLIKGNAGIDMFDFRKHYKEVKEKPLAKPIIEGETTLIGTSYKRNVYISNRAKHVFVCGTTGSGKTVALSNFIKSGMDYDYPMLIVDGKGDIGADSLLDITQRLGNGRKIYLIDLNNPETSDKYNPFKNTSVDVIKDMLINRINRLERL